MGIPRNFAAAPTDSLHITTLARAFPEVVEAVEVEVEVEAVRPLSELGFRELGRIMRVGCKRRHC